MKDTKNSKQFKKKSKGGPIFGAILLGLLGAAAAAAPIAYYFIMNKTEEKGEVINPELDPESSEGVKIDKTKSHIVLNQDSTIALTIPEETVLSEVDLKINDQIVESSKYTIKKNTLHIPGNVMTHKKICVGVKTIPSSEVTISLDPESISDIYPGQERQINCHVTPSIAEVTWESSYPEYATVDQNGKVTALAAGATTITAKCASKEATCNVTVNDFGISFDKTSASIQVEGSTTITATTSPEGGEIAWDYDHDIVSAVIEGSTCTITGLQEGTCTVTATYAGKQATCEVTVTPKITRVPCVGTNTGTTPVYLSFWRYTDKTSKYNANLSYSLDDGSTWTEFTERGQQIIIQPQATIRLKGNNPGGFSKYENGSIFTNTIVINGDEGSEFTIGGSIMALIDNNGENPVSQSWKLPAFCFNEIFYNSKKIKRVSQDFLSESQNYMSTNSKGVFSGAFKDCSNLVNAPDLPSEIVSEKCYNEMFYGCTSLTEVPSTLPGKEMAQLCYANMFAGCTSLETTPTLPAETLANYCYMGMFSGCTSLGAAPTLPAVNMAQQCYDSMFSDCIKLTTPANLMHISESFSGCCTNMYKGCSSLKIAENDDTEVTGTPIIEVKISIGNYSGMFANTGGKFTSDPESGKTYKFYL